MNGAVAAGHEVTADAAAEILRAGGNAFDAAIAAVFAACVAEPVLCSLGGGGFLLARGDREQPRVFDFFTQTPRSRLPVTALDFHPVKVDFGDAQQEFHVGLGACATPGCVAGLYEVHRELGSVPMRELVQPALAAARNGITVTDLQGYIFSLVAPIYTNPAAQGVFLGTDRENIARAGEVMRFPGFADFLEVMALEGEGLFYRGEIAALIAGMCAEHGGCLTRDDLKSYRAVVRKPLSTDYRGTRVLTNPPPSSGGVLVAFALKLLEPTAVASHLFGSYEHLRLLIDVMRATNQARLDRMCDEVSVDLLSEPLLRAYREQVHGRSMARRGTTHISVIDRRHNIAAVTISNGEGCGSVIPDTSIMLNNTLGEEDLNPSGFHQWQPDQRMSSMMAPSVVMRPDGGLLAFGSGGSNRIRTVLLQMISNLIDFGLDVEAAARAPRIHIEERVLNIEGGIDTTVVERLADEFPERRVFGGRNLFFGGAHIVASDGGGFTGAGDPRRGGVCRIV